MCNLLVQPRQNVGLKLGNQSRSVCGCSTHVPYEIQIKKILAGHSRELSQNLSLQKKTAKDHRQKRVLESVMTSLTVCLIIICCSFPPSLVGAGLYNWVARRPT